MIANVRRGAQCDACYLRFFLACRFITVRAATSLARLPYLPER